MCRTAEILFGLGECEATTLEEHKRKHLTGVIMDPVEKHSLDGLVGAGLLGYLCELLNVAALNDKLGPSQGGDIVAKPNHTCLQTGCHHTGLGEVWSLFWRLKTLSFENKR